MIIDINEYPKSVEFVGSVTVPIDGGGILLPGMIGHKVAAGWYFDEEPPPFTLPAQYIKYWCNMFRLINAA